MTFKNNWEKTETHTQVSLETIQNILSKALPGKKPASYKVIPGGCANLNIQLHFSNNLSPLILRIYVRDPQAVYREQKIVSLIENFVPVARFFEIGEANGNSFALVEFISGISLRDLILKDPQENIQDVMIEIGKILGVIQSFHFPKSGFFERDLKISSSPAIDYVSFIQKCLKSPLVSQQLGDKKIRQIEETIQKHHCLFPDPSQTHLVHADFDPANILVDKTAGKWKVKAILDWEFSFSGPWLCDVANMLRYAHQVHPDFENFFLEGVHQSGLSLPNDWRKTVHLLNLLSLLDCLVHSSPDKRPNQCKDILELIDFLLECLK